MGHPIDKTNVLTTMVFCRKVASNVAKESPLILSAAMMLRMSLNEDQAADAIECAVEQVLDSGIYAMDLVNDPEKAVLN